MAINLPIQGTGAQITKGVQRDIWRHQPIGYSPWIVIPVNIHDEIMVPTQKDHVTSVSQTVDESVERYRTIVPLLEIEWHTNMQSWADK